LEVVLLFVDNWFKNPIDEKDISIKSSYHWFWQCLAMMPGTSRSAASIIGGTEGLSRKAAAEFSFFSSANYVSVTVYSVFVKTWGKGLLEMKGYEMILQDENHIHLFIGNIVAFVVVLAVKTFISVLTKYGFKFWVGTVIIGIALLIYFILNNGTINC
jgi:undecaprenyl-diphosphatase